MNTISIPRAPDAFLRKSAQIQYALTVSRYMDIMRPGCAAATDEELLGYFNNDSDEFKAAGYILQARNIPPRRTLRQRCRDAIAGWAFWRLDRVQRRQGRV